MSVSRSHSRAPVARAIEQTAKNCAHQNRFRLHKTRKSTRKNFYFCLLLRLTVFFVVLRSKCNEFSCHRQNFINENSTADSCCSHLSCFFRALFFHWSMRISVIRATTFTFIEWKHCWENVCMYVFCSVNIVGHISTVEPKVIEIHREISMERATKSVCLVIKDRRLPFNLSRWTVNGSSTFILI